MICLQMFVWVFFQLHDALGQYDFLTSQECKMVDNNIHSIVVFLAFLMFAYTIKTSFLNILMSSPNKALQGLENPKNTFFPSIQFIYAQTLNPAQVASWQVSLIKEGSWKNK